MSAVWHERNEMASFPFAKMPTFGEFIRIAETEFGCTYVINDISLVGPDGASMVSVFRRLQQRH